MPLPNCEVAPFLRRSGLIAALYRNSDGSDWVPDWNGTGVAGVGLISYHRTCAPAPPATVCWVQIATWFERNGSIAVTAFVMRVSSVSSVRAVPGCGAAAGTVKAVTLMVRAGASTSWSAPFFVALN